MPLIVLIPLVTGGVGFGAGLFTGSAMTKTLKWGAVGGGCYLAYRAYKGA